MARAVVSVDNRLDTVNFDDREARGRIFQSIVFARCVDELASEPIEAPIQIKADLAAAQVRTAAFGIAGLVGIPARLFPQLATNAYSFSIEFAARGFLPWQTTVAVPVQANFPKTFDGIELGQIALRRAPIVLTGRAFRFDASHQRIACSNATVALTGIWRTFAAIDPIAGAPATPALSALGGLSAPRPVGATVESVSLSPIAEPPRFLVEDAAVGANTVKVSQSVGLTVGDVLGFELSSAEETEYVAIETIAAPSDPNSPAIVTLRFPLRHRHRPETTVQSVGFPAPGPADATLVDAGAPGDVTLFVDSAAAIASPRWVRISGGSSAPEYAVAAPYEVQCDGDGYYRMPPLSRIAAFEIAASRTAPPPALSSSTTPFTPNYALFENRLDLLLS